MGIEPMLSVQAAAEAAEPDEQVPVSPTDLTSMFPTSTADPFDTATLRDSVLTACAV